MAVARDQVIASVAARPYALADRFGSCESGCRYPADMVKSLLQVAPPGTYDGMAGCAGQIVARDGWAGLYRGLGPCLVRAVPAFGVCFAVYDESLRVLLSR